MMPKTPNPSLERRRRGKGHPARLIAAALGLAAAVVLAGCSSSSGGSSTSAAKTLTIAVPSAFGSLDPALGINVRAELSLQSDLFSSLVQLNPKLQIVPDLATSWNQSSPTTWVFHLRSGAKFQNGDALDATDVVANFKRMETPSVGSTELGDLKADLTSVTAPNATTVQFNLKAPYIDFLKRVSYIYYVDVPWVAGHNPKLQANASGPYELVSFNPQTGATLKANPAYYGQQPAYPNVQLKVLATSQARVDALQAGSVDVATVLDPQSLPTLKGDSKLTAGAIPSARTIFMWFNTTKKPMDSQLVRQAINYAIDKNAIVKSVLGGSAEVLNGQVINSTYSNYDSSLQPYPYDPAKAKQLLAQAGYPNGFSTTMSVPTGSYLDGDLVSQAIQSQLKQVGINVKLDNEPLQTFIQQNLNAKTADPIRFVGYASYDTSTRGMLAYFASTSSTNDSKDPAFDPLYNTYRGATTPAAATQAANAVLQEMYTFAPVAFLYSQPLTYAVSKTVSWVPRPDDWLRAFDMSPASS
jgi:peptide/nickel transport system substrate-binding protein